MGSESNSTSIRHSDGNAHGAWQRRQKAPTIPQQNINHGLKRDRRHGSGTRSMQHTTPKYTRISCGWKSHSLSHLHESLSCRPFFSMLLSHRLSCNSLMIDSVIPAYHTLTARNSTEALRGYSLHSPKGRKFSQALDCFPKIAWEFVRDRYTWRRG